MKNNFDLKKFLVENKLTSNSKLLKEEVDYHIELLVPEVAFNVESGELADSPYEFGTEDEIEDGEVDVTTYTDGDELDEFVFDRSYKQAKHFEKEYPGLFKVVEGKALGEEEIPFKKIYKADFNEIKEYLLKKLNSKHDGQVVDGVLKELFESAENLVDEQPGTSELDAVYSVAENLEDIYYEEEKDDEYKIANEISKILERVYNA